MPRGLRHLLGSALIAATCLAESPESPRILEHPQSMSVAEGGTATFGVVAVGTPPLSYQWFTNGVLVAEATNSALPLSGLLPPADGTRVVAAVRNALAEVTSEEAVLTVIPDTERPQLLAARPGDTLRSILLTFSEPLAEGGASDPAYYTAPGLEIGAAQLLSPTRVRLLSSTQADATVYTVTVSDQVTDRAFTPNGMDPEACQLSLTSLVYVARGLKYERYEGLPADSTSLADLTNHVGYPDQPDDERLVPGAEGLYEVGDGYGARLRGYVLPPATDDYVFHVATDDVGELWLSSDDTEAALTRIAWEPLWADPREWIGDSAGNRPGCATNHCENESVPIRLEAGKRYYLELVYREGQGSDHGAVFMRRATDPEPQAGALPLWGERVGTAVSQDFLQRVSLPLAGRTPSASGNRAESGFRARVHQVDQVGTIPTVSRVSRAEQQLAGLIDPNVADLHGASDGVFTVSTVVNWDEDAVAMGIREGSGYFHRRSDPVRPDQPVPGIPGLGTSAERRKDNLAVELTTYVEFPAPGVYAMGILSSDGFRLTVAEGPPVNKGALTVQLPGGMDFGAYTVSGGTEVGGSFRPLTEGIRAQLVAADPARGCVELNNPGDVAGTIALVNRGECTFSAKLQRLLEAGALAVVVVNDRLPESPEGKYPVVMGGTPVDLPGFMITQPDGARLNQVLNTGEVLTAWLAPDETLPVSEYDGERPGAETVFAVHVLEAGVYPLRCVWFSSVGKACIEWYTLDAEGKRILLNDLDVPGALRSFRSRFAESVPPYLRELAREGQWVLLEFEGSLESAPAPEGPWTLVAGAVSPQAVETTAEAGFFRARW